MTGSRFRVPHTLVLLFAMVLLAQSMTYVLPQGSFERITNEHGREEVVADSYSRFEGATKLPWHAAFTSIPTGFAEAGEIIFFIFIVGGAFAVLRKTGATDALIAWMLSRLGHMPGLLIAVSISVFAIGSSTIGMAEEYLPFVPILLVLTRGLGFDAITAVGILCVGYGVGYGAAGYNPFTVVIAQDVAGLAPTSGHLFRNVLLLVFLPVGFHHVWSYARKIKAHPEKSLMAGIPVPDIEIPNSSLHFTRAHMLVLGLVAACIALMVYGISLHDWYLHEMGGLFIGLAILLAIIGRMGPSETARIFCEGAGELTTTALLVGFARTIQVVLDDGQVVDTIIYAIATPLESLGPSLAAVGMFGFQSLCNFFIPSGSGQAYVTMPLMAPLADLVGVQRQVAVLAYQFGDGLTNILVPTNAVLVGILAMAGVPYDRWVRFVLPFMVKMWILGALALVVAVWIGYS